MSLLVQINYEKCLYVTVDIIEDISGDTYLQRIVSSVQTAAKTYRPCSEGFLAIPGSHAPQREADVWFRNNGRD